MSDRVRRQQWSEKAGIPVRSHPRSEPAPCVAKINPKKQKKKKASNYPSAGFMFPPISREADTALGSEQYGFLIQCFNTNHSLEGKTKNIIKKKTKNRWSARPWNWAISDFSSIWAKKNHATHHSGPPPPPPRPAHITDECGGSFLHHLVRRSWTWQGKKKMTASGSPADERTASAAQQRLLITALL